MITSKTKWTSRLQCYLQQGLTTCEKQTKTCFDTPQETFVGIKLPSKKPHAPEEAWRSNFWSSALGSRSTASKIDVLAYAVFKVG
jgi:hypothetical protein